MTAPPKTQKKNKLPRPVLSRPHSDEDPRKTMWTFSGALFPAAIMSVYYFGLPALTMLFVCIVTALACEFAMHLVLSKPISLADGNAFLIGLLLALCLPSKAPLFIPVIGTFTAIVIAKHLLGMRGYAIFHPTLVGLVVVFLGFPGHMTDFSTPSATVMVVDAKTMATPLALLKQEGMGRLLEVYHTKAALYVDLLLGNRPGALGETSVAALLLGGLFLLKRHVITWHIPISFIASVGALMWLFGGREGLLTGEPIFHMLSGGLVLGAFFLATDRATVPSTRIDQVLFGIGCGALTVLFRLKTGYPEGVMFALLIMNCVTPVLERRLSMQRTLR